MGSYISQVIFKKPSERDHECAYTFSSCTESSTKRQHQFALLQAGSDDCSLLTRILFFCV